MKIVFLVSGGGGNLKFFHLVKKYNVVESFDFELFVIADRECGAIEFAENNKIPFKTIEYSRTDNSELKQELSIIDPDFIVTNWHKIIDAEIVSLYSGKLINLHYSLLPAFAGLIGVEPIKKAYDNNCQFVGATCHFVDEDVDAGKIISQGVVKTNIPIDKAIQRVFEVGALILLNSILISRGKNIAEKSKFFPTNQIVSPNLVFDAENLIHKVFKELKIL